MSAKAQSYTTETVHYAVEREVNGRKIWVQACGMGRRQLAALAKVSDDAQVTCKKCQH